MATDIFHDSHKSIPRSDPRILSQDFSKQDQGASKAAQPKLPQNTLTIAHVKK